MFSNSFFPIFDSFYKHPSVYVISDSQMSEWKRNQAEAEIIELDKLIAGHESSIERLKSTRDQLRADYPALESEEKQSTIDKPNTSSV